MSVVKLIQRLDADNPLRATARWLRSLWMRTSSKAASARGLELSPRAVPAQVSASISLPAVPAAGVTADLDLVATILRERSTTLGAHIEALDAIDRVNAASGNSSHTTLRFRRELLYWLLDNPARGPIVEVGTMYGGMTSLFGYIAAATGRHCFAIDINPVCLERTRQTCSTAGVAAHVTLFSGDLIRFLAKHAAALDRPDLVFLDSSHDYNSTMIELRALHGSPRAIPRALVFHDYNYRHAAQVSWFDDCVGKNPIAIDLACRKFFADEFSGSCYFKRCGAFSGDGTVATPDNPGAMMGDYIDRYGTEGMMVLYP
jgi:predicted O-methyltransferase YrrM